MAIVTGIPDWPAACVAPGCPLHEKYEQMPFTHPGPFEADWGMMQRGLLSWLSD